MTANKGDEFGEPIIGGKCWEKGARNDFEKACAFPPPQIAPKPVSKVRKSPAPPKRRAEHKTPPKKPLNLRLVGTAVGSEGIRFAIIEDSTSKAQTIHREGDRIQGAVLQKVDRGGNPAGAGRAESCLPRFSRG